MQAQNLHSHPNERCGFVSVLKQMLIGFVEANFPTKMEQPEGAGVCTHHQDVCTDNPVERKCMRPAVSADER